jgi:hypothetical protein
MKSRDSLAGASRPKKENRIESASQPFTFFIFTAMSEVKYSEAQFNKAAEIIKSLPKDGPVKPSQEDQLFVRYIQSHDLI